jgi:hypothetical protein
MKSGRRRTGRGGRWKDGEEREWRWRGRRNDGKRVVRIRREREI